MLGIGFIICRKIKFNQEIICDIDNVQMIIVFLDIFWINCYYGLQDLQLSMINDIRLILENYFLRKKQLFKNLVCIVVLISSDYFKVNVEDI